MSTDSYNEWNCLAWRNASGWLAAKAAVDLYPSSIPILPSAFLGPSFNNCFLPRSLYIPHLIHTNGKILIPFISLPIPFIFLYFTRREILWNQPTWTAAMPRYTLTMENHPFIADSLCISCIFPPLNSLLCAGSIPPIDFPVCFSPFPQPLIATLVTVLHYAQFRNSV